MNDSTFFLRNMLNLKVVYLYLILNIASPVPEILKPKKSPKL